MNTGIYELYEEYRAKKAHYVLARLERIDGKVTMYYDTVSIEGFLFARGRGLKCQTVKHTKIDVKIVIVWDAFSDGDELPPKHFGAFWNSYLYKKGA